MYHRDTETLLPYYRAKGMVRELGGTGNITRVLALLESSFGDCVA